MHEDPRDVEVCKAKAALTKMVAAMGCIFCAAGCCYNINHCSTDALARETERRKGFGESTSVPFNNYNENNNFSSSQMVTPPQSPAPLSGATPPRERGRRATVPNLILPGAMVETKCGPCTANKQNKAQAVSGISTDEALGLSSHEKSRTQPQPNAWHVQPGVFKLGDVNQTSAAYKTETENMFELLGPADGAATLDTAVESKETEGWHFDCRQTGKDIVDTRMKASEEAQGAPLNTAAELAAAKAAENKAEAAAELAAAKANEDNAEAELLADAIAHAQEKWKQVAEHDLLKQRATLRWARVLQGTRIVHWHKFLKGMVLGMLAAYAHKGQEEHDKAKMMSPFQFGKKADGGIFGFGGTGGKVRGFPKAGSVAGTPAIFAPQVTFPTDFCDVGREIELEKLRSVAADRKKDGSVARWTMLFAAAWTVARRAWLHNFLQLLEEASCNIDAEAFGRDDIGSGSPDDGYDEADFASLGEDGDCEGADFLPPSSGMGKVPSGSHTWLKGEKAWGWKGDGNYGYGRNHRGDVGVEEWNHTVQQFAALRIRCKQTGGKWCGPIMESLLRENLQLFSYVGCEPNDDGEYVDDEGLPLLRWCEADVSDAVRYSEAVAKTIITTCRSTEIGETVFGRPWRSFIPSCDVTTAAEVKQAAAEAALKLLLVEIDATLKEEREADQIYSAFNNWASNWADDDSTDSEVDDLLQFQADCDSGVLTGAAVDVAWAKFEAKHAAKSELIAHAAPTQTNEMEEANCSSQIAPIIRDELQVKNGAGSEKKVEYCGVANGMQEPIKEATGGETQSAEQPVEMAHCAKQIAPNQTSAPIFSDELQAMSAGSLFDLWTNFDSNFAAQLQMEIGAGVEQTVANCVAGGAHQTTEDCEGAQPQAPDHVMADCAKQPAKEANCARQPAPIRTSAPIMCNELQAAIGDSSLAGSLLDLWMNFDGEFAAQVTDFLDGLRCEERQIALEALMRTGPRVASAN